MAGLTKYFLSTPYQVINGQIAFAAHLNNPFTNVATGFTAMSTDIQTSGSKTGSDTGTANAYAVALDPPISSYVDGLEVWLKTSTTNTGDATLNVNSLGAIPIKRHGLSAISAGDIAANYYTLLKYSNSVFQIVSTSGKAEVSADAAAVSAAAAAADLVLTNADVVLTHADVVLTHADVASTNADVVLTHADVVATGLDRDAVEAITIDGLEKVTEGGNTGWRLIGKVAANYGDIGAESVDLSHSPSTSTTRGATGTNSLSMGNQTTAAGDQSTSMGYLTTASGNRSTSMGYLTAASGSQSTSMGDLTTASGNRSTSMGFGTVAQNDNQSSSGIYNVGTDTGTILEVGIGTSAAAKANGLEVHTDGLVLAPEAETADIHAGDSQALITKAYFVAYTAIQSGMTGLEAVTENTNTGWRLIGRDPTYYGDIGEGAVGMSESTLVSTTKGATGDYSFTVGLDTDSTGNYSVATGRGTFASGSFSMANGSATVASGDYSRAEGEGSQAVGDHSSASGFYTTAQNNFQATIGKHNVGTDTGTIFEVGIGASPGAKANGLEVHTDGKILMPALPTSDPVEAGALWNDSGTLKISAG